MKKSLIVLAIATAALGSLEAGRAENLDLAPLSCDRTHLPSSRPWMTAAKLVRAFDGGEPTARHLQRVFCSLVSESPKDGRLFFEHAPFEKLSEAEQESFFGMMARTEPALLLQRAAFEPTIPRSAIATAASELEKESIQLMQHKSVRDQMLLFLGPGPKEATLTPRQRRMFRDSKRVGPLLSDPAIAKVFPAIRDEWMTGLAGELVDLGLLYRSNQEYVQAKVLIARNLWLRELPAGAESVRTEYERILLARNQYSELLLFEQRQVLYFASDLQDDEGHYLAADRDTLHRIDGQGAAVEVIREGTPEAKTALEGLGRSLARPETTVTLVFEGHSSRRGLEFDGRLTPNELAASLDAAPRATAESPSIFIALTCEGQNFGRALLARLQEQGERAPQMVIIAPEEYGQKFVKYPGDRFLGSETGLSNGQTATVGRLLAKGRIGTSIFVPGLDNRSVQIL